MSVTTIKKDQLFGIITILALVAGLIAALIAVRQIQETRRRASEPHGSASIELDPADLEESIIAGTPTTLKLKEMIATPTDGFQMIADFTGSLPSNLTFTPTSLPGLDLVRNQLTTTENGQRLTLAYVSQNPTQPYTSSAILGSLTFTAPGNGTLFISFDSTQSIVAENASSQDVLATPALYRYSFMTPASPPPSPSPTPPPSPSPSPKASPSPSPKPSPKPSKKPGKPPIPIPSVKPPLQ